MHHYKWGHLSLCEGETWHHLSLAFFALQTLCLIPVLTPAVTFQLHSIPSLHHDPSCSSAVALVSLLGWMHCLLCLLLTLHVQSDIPSYHSRDLRLSVMRTISAFINFDKHLIYCFFNSMEHSSTSKHFHLYLVYNTPKILTVIFLLLLITLPPQQSCSPQSSWILSCLFAELDYYSHGSESFICIFWSLWQACMWFLFLILQV